jgi:DNA-binding transcriptional LysR family regulator
MRFDWTDLQLFLHACEAGSLTGAAEQSHLTLAAASARIRGMEEQAGTALLRRHSRGVRPTPAGETLAQHARAVLAQMALLQGALAEHGRGARGRLRLLCNSSAAFTHLPPLLGAFLKRHATVDLAVEESPSHLTVQALRDGTADIGVVSSAVDTSDLAATHWRNDPLVLVLPRGHVLARQRKLSFAQVLEHDYIASGPASALHAHLVLQAAQLGRSMRIRASFANFDAVCALVEQGVGVAVMTAALLKKSTGFDARLNARLSVRPLTDAWARRSLLLCRPARTQGTPLAEELANFLLAAHSTE